MSWRRSLNRARVQRDGANLAEQQLHDRLHLPALAADQQLQFTTATVIAFETIHEIGRGPLQDAFPEQCGLRLAGRPFRAHPAP